MSVHSPYISGWCDFGVATTFPLGHRSTKGSVNLAQAPGVDNKFMTSLKDIYSCWMLFGDWESHILHPLYTIYVYLCIFMLSFFGGLLQGTTMFWGGKTTVWRSTLLTPLAHLPLEMAITEAADDWPLARKACAIILPTTWPCWNWSKTHSASSKKKRFPIFPCCSEHGLCLGLVEKLLRLCLRFLWVSLWGLWGFFKAEYV